MLFAYPIPSNFTAWGVISIVESCDSTGTYITVTNPLNQYNENKVYLLDFATQSATFLCNTPGPILGAATPNEFLASDCSIRLDLDADDSSGAMGSDFQAAPFCGEAAVAIADTDLVFYSGYHVDSIQIRLLLPMPNAPLEYLSATATGSVAVAGSGGARLRLSAAHGTAVATANTDYEDALRAVRWHNDAPAPTPGPRTVEVIAFATGGRSDTAYAFVPVPSPAIAGPDTTIALCPDAPAFDLSAGLSASATAGGLWSPLPLSGTTLFVPGTDAPGAFNYIVSNGFCPGDTAVIGISLLPEPVFSLGADRLLCAGSSILLAPVPLPAAMFEWQDEAVQPNFSATQPGLYWAEASNANGCHWRDSVLIGQADTFRLEEQALRCAGQNYIWQGQAFSADTSLCLNFSTVQGCDSVHCLNLAFYYPAIRLDTTICAGQSLDWLGTPGIYSDTLLTSPGCDSVVVLTLQHWPAPIPPVIQGDALICTGDTTVFSTGSYAAYSWSTGSNATETSADQAGVYSVTVSDANGCTAVGSISMSLLPPPEVNWNSEGPACHNSTDGFIELTAISGGTPPFLFQINGDSGTDQPYFPNLDAGIWSVQVQDAEGCVSSQTFTLAKPPEWTLSPQPPTVVLQAGETATLQVLSNLSGSFSYQWTPTSGLSCADCPSPVAQPADTTFYQLIATDAAGCTATAAYAVFVLRDKAGLYLPNVFSPNADGQNDYFTLLGDPTFFEKINLLQMYDRWGNLVFEGYDLPINNENTGWDGTFKG